MKYPLTYYINLWSNVIPIAAGAYAWPDVKTNNSGSALMFIFVVLGGVTELVGYWMASNGIHNLWVLHVYDLGEYVLLMFLFAGWIERLGVDQSSPTRYLTPAVLKWSIIPYTLFWLISKWTFEKWDQPGGYSVTVSALIFITLCLVVLFAVRSRKQTQPRPTLKTFQFWAALGILLYFAGSAVQFLLISSLVNLSRESFLHMWTVHWIVNIVANLSYAYGFRCLIQA